MAASTSSNQEAGRMSDSSVTTVPDLQSSSSPVQSLSNLRVGMQREVYEAAESGSVEALRWHNNWKHQKTVGGNNVLHIHLRRLTKIHRGVRVVTDDINMSFVQYVIGETSEDSVLLLQRNDKGDTPLHLAARFGHTSVVQEFLTTVSDELLRLQLLNTTNSRKDTALHDAARASNAGIVKLLVEAGTENEDALLPHMPNNVGETPLFLAVERGSFESFDVIAGRTGLAAFEHKGPCGQTALHIAVLSSNTDIVARILETNTSNSLIRVKNDEGRTPLHCCAAQDGESGCSILRALINQDDEYNSAAYIQDNEGRTPFHVASLNLNFNGAQMLARSHPDCIEIIDNEGQNVLHSAANLGKLISFNELLRKVPQCEMLINEKDNDGNTPLHLLTAMAPMFPFYDFNVRLPVFLGRHKNNLDVMAFNDKNLTIKRDESMESLPTSKRIPMLDTADGTRSAKRIDDLAKLERINHLRQVAGTRLVVAALIATVSFTAGFTPPGGFDQFKGKTIGLAVLANKVPFIVFLVSDTIAFTTSSLAIICYFALASQGRLTVAQELSILAELMTSVSLGALVIAFTSGVCSVVSHVPGLALTIIAIISSFLFFFWKEVVSAFFIKSEMVTTNIVSVGFLSKISRLVSCFPHFLPMPLGTGFFANIKQFRYNEIFAKWTL